MGALLEGLWNMDGTPGLRSALRRVPGQVGRGAGIAVESVLKTVVTGNCDRGFESHALRR